MNPYSETLDIAYLGQPFVRLESAGLTTTTLDVAYLGVPFVGYTVASVSYQLLANAVRSGVKLLPALAASKSAMAGAVIREALRDRAAALAGKNQLSGRVTSYVKSAAATVTGKSHLSGETDVATRLLGARLPTKTALSGAGLKTLKRVYGLAISRLPLSGRVKTVHKLVGARLPTKTALSGTGLKAIGKLYGLTLSHLSLSGRVKTVHKLVGAALTSTIRTTLAAAAVKASARVNSHAVALRTALRGGVKTQGRLKPSVLASKAAIRAAHLTDAARILGATALGRINFSGKVRGGSTVKAASTTLLTALHSVVANAQRLKGATAASTTSFKANNAKALERLKGAVLHSGSASGLQTAAVTLALRTGGAFLTGTAFLRGKIAQAGALSGTNLYSSVSLSGKIRSVLRLLHRSAGATKGSVKWVLVEHRDNRVLVAHPSAKTVLAESGKVAVCEN